MRRELRSPEEVKRDLGVLVFVLRFRQFFFYSSATPQPQHEQNILPGFVGQSRDFFATK